jgi:predicted phage-related endonuclease
MKIITGLVQGSPEWVAFRAEHDGASEAAAMLGISKLMKRDELLHLKTSGNSKEFSDWVQKNILDHGHAVEELARPIIDEFYDDEFSPVTCEDGRLSASCDGLNFSKTRGWEHKQWNEALAESIRENILPEEHYPQVQQELMVTGAESWIFTVSDGTLDNMVSMEVFPDPVWFDRLRAGWVQFNKDRANYVHVEVIDAPEADAIQSLPAVTIQVSGEMTLCNLDTVTPKFDAFLEKAEAGKSNISIHNGDAIAKFSRAAAVDCKLTAKSVVSQMTTVNEAVTKLDLYAKKFDAMGLAYEKEVDRLKEIEKVAALNAAKSAYAEHVAGLQAEIKGITLVLPPVDFQLAIKGLKTAESKNNALNTALANGKIASDAIAKDIRAKLDWCKNNADGKSELFPDLQQVIYKPFDDFTLLITSRIEKQKTDEAARVEAQRVAMQAAADAKAKAEADAVIAAERAKMEAEERAKVAAGVKAQMEAQAAQSAKSAADALVVNEIISGEQDTNPNFGIQTPPDEIETFKIQREGAKRAGAIELMELFISKYGDIDDFGIVTDAIKKWLKK